MSEFSKWFQQQLRRREWTQADFVRRAEQVRGKPLASSTVSTWASGARTPGPYALELIAEVLDYTVESVFEAAGFKLIPNVDDLPADDPILPILGLVHSIDWNKRRNRLLATRVLETILEGDRMDAELERDEARARAAGLVSENPSDS